MLRNKHILVGISGGIAAYKIPELIRLLRKAGAEVRVVVTPNALQFVTSLTLETLSDGQVYSDVFAPHNEHHTEHISLPEWADLFMVAPCTADVIGKMANGIADDALTTTFLATDKPVLIAPAMNERMYLHPAVQQNMRTLASWHHVTLLDAPAGELACGTTGKGRMQEPAAILEAADTILQPKTMVGRKVLITAGPTQEQLDPVRYISNYSTGKMGYALANLCRKKGADVTLVSGPTNLRFEGDTIHVTSADEMYAACMERFAETDICILCAAVADFAPDTIATSKIKRGTDALQLSLRPTHDIARSLGERKTGKQLLVGFALETDNETANALGKMQRKNLDYIVLNSLREEGAGFGCDTNKVTVFSKDGHSQTFPLKNKQEVAADILSFIGL
ncbi:MAG: bifunctional phosphopantothenoylcysteine decarboxylase/phosphopantothenate--cysteine ligase CoaBC [Paludibacter sp.]|nr:bifunctional phosphopantothenoylcysteine decarboxylase/phosphopantothenate--cysteine ligase CoaBC [Bacteroidales bacterium]MCM1069304.1 bifunctional phosphopantothenoylcysteine decarboxylase/phosphopantothenate--cysteine ligase CoaBC [Prevotella sp.]MCM1353713.1 bifunctional phosphopantothenoylcysteine decarboxylase/phosphopantothenate--cysteine ligase CoaBC [Bacteroides sp.]MCM1442219.1 bifunctional phosphopantothenoylcysteine decarboxylase/phosphopantothenate--cysteine ligase CoaBC [Muribac